MESLSVVTLNMQNAMVWDPEQPDSAPIRIQDTIDFLQSSSADIFLLQEMELPPGPVLDRDHHPNHDALMAAFPDWHHAFAWPTGQRPHLPFGLGLAILSRLPLTDVHHYVLPAANLTFPFGGVDWQPANRSLLGAFVRVGNQRIHILTTHLQAYFVLGTSSDLHPQQRQVVHTVIKGRKTPLILGGDFNSAPGEHTVEDLEATGLERVPNNEATWWRDDSVLDHLFHSPELNLVGWTLHSNTCSDHKALEAQYLVG